MTKNNKNSRKLNSQQSVIDIIEAKGNEAAEALASLRRWNKGKP